MSRSMELFRSLLYYYHATLLGFLVSVWLVHSWLLVETSARITFTDSNFILVICRSVELMHNISDTLKLLVDLFWFYIFVSFVTILLHSFFATTYWLRLQVYWTCECRICCSKFEFPIPWLNCSTANHLFDFYITSWRPEACCTSVSVSFAYRFGLKMAWCVPLR